MEEVKRQVVDIVLFNNELELLDLRVKLLEDVVDFFIVKEATHTFQGDPKELLLLKCFFKILLSKGTYCYTLKALGVPQGHGVLTLG